MSRRVLLAKQAQPETKRRAGKTIKKQPKRIVSYQIADIKTAETLALNADLPYRIKLFQIFAYIRKDGEMVCQVNTAHNKVAAEPWLFYRNNNPDIAHTDLFNKTWFNAIIRYIVEAEWNGFSVVELNGLTPQTADIEEVVLIDREYIGIEQQVFYPDGNAWGNGISYADIAWDIDLLEFGSRDDLGTFLSCAYNVIWKYYGRNDWSRTSERWGQPILTIAADTNDDDELDELEARASNFGTNGYFIGQKDDEINMLERTGQRMHDIFFDNIKYCDEQNGKIINGNTATTNTKAFTGSAEVQERTMDDFTMARMQRIVNEVNNKLLPYLEYKGFPVKGYRFDYPKLKQEREKRIKGQTTPTDPKEQPKDETKPALGKEDK